MSRRLNRRQQRQLEELDQLQGALEEGGENDVQEDVKDEATRPTRSAFAALQLDEPEEETNEGGDDDDAEETTSSSQSTAKKSKKNKKKNKKKGEKGPASTNVDDLSLEEMAAVIGTSTKQSGGAERQNSNAITTPKKTPVAAFRALLALDATHLDPANELRRQFGSAAIKAYERERGGNTASVRAGARTRDNRGAQFNSNMRARTVLCSPKPTWPDLSRSFVGMSMSVSEPDKESGVRVYSWEHSRAYKQAQFQFAQAVGSFDTQSLVALLRVFPWHIDTLLQLAAVSRYQGDLGQVSDFIDRALFAFERSALATFVSGLTSSSGPPMCDFFRAENRAFWLAVHRNIDLFGRRGTWRTALEWCKLLYALDTTDPHGILLWTDFLAIKAKQPDWLLAVVDGLDTMRESGSVLDWSVGLSFARALAMRLCNSEKKDAALADAIARHPRAAILLAQKLDVCLPEEVVQAFPMRETYTHFDPAFDELLAHLYVHRSHSLWKEAGPLAWFRDVVTNNLLSAHKVPGAKTQADQVTRMGVYRHLVVADLPEALQQQLMRYMPPDVRNPPGGIDTFDPLPPKNGTRFDDAYYGGLLGDMSQRGGRTGLWELLQRLQNLGVHDVQQLLELVDDRTRDLLMQVMVPAGETAQGASDDDVDDMPSGEQADDAQAQHGVQEGAQESRSTSHSEEPSGGEPGLLQRAWNALWGA